MSFDSPLPQPGPSSPSPTLIIHPHLLSTTTPDTALDNQNRVPPPMPCSSSCSPHMQSYASSSHIAKGKRRATDDHATQSLSDHALHLSAAMSRLSMLSSLSPVPLPHTHSSPGANRQRAASDQPLVPPSHVPRSAKSTPELPSPPASYQHTQPERRTRKRRDAASRSLAPSPLRSALTTSPSTGTASQFVSLLGQPVAVSASLSAPNKCSAAVTSAVLPSLYKASRGRSTNVSPSRRWDRRGASATVLSGASASGSGGEADDFSDEDLINHQPSPSFLSNTEASARRPSRRLSVTKQQALFPSDDDDDSPPLSPTHNLSRNATNIAQHHRSRRWSSIERERSRGMRILLQDHPNALDDSLTAQQSASKPSSRLRGRSALRFRRAPDEDASDLESSSAPSSCTSSCDLNYIPTPTDTAAIPIKERRSRSNGRNNPLPDSSVSAASSQGHVPSSTDGSDDPSHPASTPSTSLVQRSPPGFIALKPILAIPVTSESDPLLGLATPSVEDMIQVDQVEFFPEDAITAQLSSANAKRKSSPRQSKKSSWIIGDFESEPESDDEQASIPSLDSAVNRSHATAITASPPSSIANSYHARLASLQSQLRIWSRTQDHGPAPRVRQISSSSEDHIEAEAEARDAETNSPGLLSASWRNLARLPNLILLPGLAARQARESQASASKPQAEGIDRNSADSMTSPTSDNDFAQIYRLASSTKAPSDADVLQAQRNVALKTGRPPSPSPSPSPPASLLGSRQSSNDSISTSDKGQHPHNLAGPPRRGRGVASPLEADRDPSAYVSGLGQPIDPDTELSSVVQLQTFRSRSRSRPADVRHRSRAAEDSRVDAQRHPAQRDKFDDSAPTLSPQKLAPPIELESTEQEETHASSVRSARGPARPLALKGTASEPRVVQAPKLDAPSESRPHLDRHDPFADGPAPTDTASAPTSPTFRKGDSSSASSADETDSIPSPPHPGDARDGASVDAYGFRVVRRRHRRRSSGPRSLRPKVDAPVPLGYSAFAIDGGDEDAAPSDSDGEVTPSPGRPRRSRGRRGRDSSPRRSTRQCAVGLFGGGVSAAPSSMSSPSTSRSHRSSRREGSHISVSTPIRSVRSSPDLTYAAAAATAREGEQEGQRQSSDDPSPPRGSRGRRGAVKVVASSVGQRPSMAHPLILGGLESIRRGPSYPPRAGEILDDEGGEDDSQSSPQYGSNGGRGRSVSSTACGNTAAPQALRFRLLSNSSHLLMLSLELDMIKKQKISAPLKPRWGKHRANDFNPLPSTISYSSSYASSKYLRSPFSASRDTDADACEDGECSPCDAVSQEDQSGTPTLRATVKSGATVTTIGGGLRDPSSRLRFSWSWADIASALDSAATPTQR